MKFNTIAGSMLPFSKPATSSEYEAYASKSPDGKMQVLVKRKGSSCNGADIGMEDAVGHKFAVTGCSNGNIADAREFLRGAPTNFTPSVLTKPEPNVKLGSWSGVTLYGTGIHDITPEAQSYINNITAAASASKAAADHRLTVICAPIVAVSGAMLVGLGVWRMCIVPARREARLEAERQIAMEQYGHLA